MESGATNAKKENGFCKEPPSRTHHWPVPLPKDWQIIPLDYPRRRRSQRFAHCAFTVRSRIARRTRISSTNVHTRTLTKTGRLNGCFSLDTHTHTHLVSTVSHRHDARTRIKPRKKKEKITTRPPGTRVPPRFFTRVCGLGLAMTRCSIGPFSISFFLLFYDYSGRGESVWMTQERDNLFTTVFVLYIIDGRKKKKKKQGNSGNRNLSLGRHVTIYRGYYS